MSALAIAPIGHNNPPPHVLMLEDAQELKTKAAALQIASADDAATAAQLLDVATKGKRDADRARQVEKEPHLEAGRKVDAAWKPAVETYDAAAAILKSKGTEWIKAERARQAREAEEARLEEERRQEAAMAALARQQAEGGFVAELEAEMAVAEADAASARAEALAAATAAPAQLRAEGVRARGIRTTWTVEVTDGPALVRALADHPTLIEEATKIAKARARVDKSALKLDGCRTVEVESL